MRDRSVEADRHSRQGGALGLLNSHEGDGESDTFPASASNQVCAGISSPEALTWLVFCQLDMT